MPGILCPNGKREAQHAPQCQEKNRIKFAVNYVFTIQSDAIATCALTPDRRMIAPVPHTLHIARAFVRASLITEDALAGLRASALQTHCHGQGHPTTPHSTFYRTHADQLCALCEQKMPLYISVLFVFGFEHHFFGYLVCVSGEYTVPDHTHMVSPSVSWSSSLSLANESQESQRPHYDAMPAVRGQRMRMCLLCQLVGRCR